MIDTRRRVAVLVGATLLATSGCGTPTASAPTPVAVDSSATTPASGTPIAVASSPATASASPESRPTPLPRATAQAKPRATAVQKRKPTVSISCEPSVSMESGDPLLIVTWSVRDPDNVGWTIGVSYTNDFGQNGARFSGKGSKSRTINDYGMSPEQSDPGCEAFFE